MFVFASYVCMCFWVFEFDVSKGGSIVDGDGGGGFYAYLGFGNYGLPLPVPDCHHVIFPTVYAHEPLTVILHQSNTVMIKTTSFIISVVVISCKHS